MSVDYSAIEVREWNDSTGTAHVIEDFRRRMAVEVRLHGNWWPAEIWYINIDETLFQFGLSVLLLSPPAYRRQLDVMRALLYRRKYLLDSPLVSGGLEFRINGCLKSILIDNHR
jgi:hypothetical protein